VDFDLSHDQKMMQASLDGTLARVCPLDRVRKIGDAREAYAPDVFAALCDLGATGIVTPEDYGGMGLTMLDAALVAEMLGRHVAPVPFLATALMAPLALLGAGSVAQKSEWLPKLAVGKAIAGVAVSEHASGARDGAGIAPHNGRLSGQSLFVLDSAADLFVIADKHAELHLVAADAKGLSRLDLPTIDATRSISSLSFKNVEAEPLSAGSGPAAVERMIDAGRVALAADTLGASFAMLEKAVAYAKERRQFGRFIGSFQAVKHLCAEMVAELEPARALVWYAGYSFDMSGAQSRALVAHAKAHLAEVGRFVARTATEVHGGMGFTDLLGLHYWFKRVGVNRQLLGGPERARHDAALAQGWLGN